MRWEMYTTRPYYKPVGIKMVWDLQKKGQID